MGRYTIPDETNSLFVSSDLRSALCNAYILFSPRPLSPLRKSARTQSMLSKSMIQVISGSVSVS